MANEKVNSLITDLLKRAKQIESEDGKSFMELDELRRWAAAPMIDRRPVASRMARVLRKMALTSVFVEHGGGSYVSTSNYTVKGTSKPGKCGWFRSCA